MLTTSAKFHRFFHVLNGKLARMGRGWFAKWLIKAKPRGERWGQLFQYPYACLGIHDWHNQKCTKEWMNGMRMRPGASSAQDAVKEGKLLSDLLGPYCLAALLCLSDWKNNDNFAQFGECLHCTSLELEFVCGIRKHPYIVRYRESFTESGWCPSLQICFDGLGCERDTSPIAIQDNTSVHSQFADWFDALEGFAFWWTAKEEIWLPVSLRQIRRKIPGCFHVCILQRCNELPLDPAVGPFGQNVLRDMVSGKAKPKASGRGSNIALVRPTAQPNFNFIPPPSRKHSERSILAWILSRHIPTVPGLHRLYWRWSTFTRNTSCTGTWSLQTSSFPRVGQQGRDQSTQEKVLFVCLHIKHMHMHYYFIDSLDHLEMRVCFVQVKFMAVIKTSLIGVETAAY